MEYRTYFKLTNEVNDLMAAREYLTEDDMTQYIEYGDCPDGITHIEWVLTDYREGYVQLITEREFSEEELQKVSEWVSGQNSDGLGEGFEQQDFAEVRYEDEDGYTMMGPDDYASFDWMTNDYEFVKVSE